MSKRKKLKLPKRIAGVKIPKAARKGPVADFLNSSAGQLLLAETLLLAVGVFGVRRLNTSSTPQDVRETLAEASARLSNACSEALRAFRAALAEPPAMSHDPEETSVQLTEEPDPELVEESATVKKKRRKSHSEMASPVH